MVARVSALVLLASMSQALAASDPYATSIELSNGAPGAPTKITFRFRATSDVVERVNDIEIGLPEGSSVDSAAFRYTCQLEGTGPESGAVCGEQYEEARVGYGTMTVELLGMYSLRAAAYRIVPTTGGENLVFFFPGGQIFGVGPQSIFGSVTLEPSGPARLRMTNIQQQLDLPFGATAELEEGVFAFTGESGSPGFRNPSGGALGDWRFRTELAWGDGRQTQRVHAVAPD